MNTTSRVFGKSEDTRILPTHGTRKDTLVLSYTQIIKNRLQAYNRNRKNKEK